MADLGQHLPDIVPAVFGALKAWEDELRPYMADDEPVVVTTPKENRETRRQGKRKATEESEGRQAKVNRIRARENALLVLQEVGVPVAQRGIREYDELMRERGWVEYQPSANTPRVLYESANGTKAC